MLTERTVVTYGRKGKGFRIRAWRQPADWNALGITIEETTASTFRSAVATAKRMARDHGADFSEQEMRRYFGM